MPTTITRIPIVSLLLAVALGWPGAAQASAGQTRSSRGANSGLHVIPFPGTPDAAPSSNVIFSSLHRSQIVSVMADGSSSGTHYGHFKALPDGAGTAWVPDSPFTPGERVSVTATLTSPQAGTASGKPGATTLSFTFTVAVQNGRGGAPAAQPGGSARNPTQRFVSEPAIRPPVVSVSSDPDTSSGDILLTPYKGLQSGPMILNPAGQLVWFLPLPGWTANLEVQRYRGKPVLSFWHEDLTGAVEDVVMNHRYRTLAALHGANGYPADMHELQLTPQGTALIDALVPVRANLTSVGGSSDGRVVDCVVQELDVRTGALLWEWHSLGHVPLSASYEPLPSSSAPWGYCHINSIQQVPGGNLLLSFRHTWGVYLINKQTGRVIWTLGGKYSSFHMGQGTSFEWQHDARLHGNVLTLFDDGWNGHRGAPEERQASAKAIKLDTSTMTATLVHSYVHSPPLIAASQGNAQLLPNGNMFVGWGSQPDFSEYAPGGRQIFNGTFALGVRSYRAYRFPWKGRPLTPPSIGLRSAPGGRTAVYASWNGATDVAAWRILGGASAKHLYPLAQTRRAGFETARTVRGEPPYLAVQALSRHRHVLGTSLPAADPPHLAIFGSTVFVRGSQGTGSVAVGCFTGQSCLLTLQITSHGRVLATHSSHSIPSGTGTLVGFRLSAAGIKQLGRARGHRLPVRVSLRDASGISTTLNLDLIPYSISGARAPRRVSQSATLQIVQDTGFVSPTGAGHILAACYSPVPCRVQAKVSAHGSQIARSGREYLGPDELGFVSFTLSSGGRARLEQARDNQLPARITLTSGGAHASGQVALVSYR